MLSGPFRSFSRMSCTTRSRLLRVVLFCSGLLLTTAGSPPQVLARTAAAAAVQDPPAVAPDQKETEERELLRQVQETEQLLSDKKWLEAAEQFEAAWELAAASSDPVLEKRGADVRQLAPGQTDVVAGGRARLELLFRSAAPEFRTEYSRQFEAAAQQKMQPAIVSGNSDLLRRMALRFQFTQAGRNGLKTLARLFADRGDFVEAAVLLERTRLAEGDSARLLLQTAWCYAMAGLRQDAADLSQLARSENFAPAVIADPVARSLQADIERLLTSPLASGTSAEGWRQPNGNYRRTGLQNLSAPRLRNAQTASLFEVTDVLYAEQLNPPLAALTEYFGTQHLQDLKLNNTAVPATGILIAGELYYVRTPIGVQARSLQTGELVWEVVRPDRPLRTLLSPPQPADAASVELQLSRQIIAGLYYQLIRTTTCGQMAVSGSTLYTLEENTSAVNGLGAVRGLNDSAVPQLPTNYLRAYDAQTGVFLWQAGGQTQDANPLNRGQANLLAGYYFLGAPLILGNRIYVLAENSEGIHLIRLGEPQPGRPDANPTILASQLLTLPENPLSLHPLRKHAGLTPSFAQGLLICPLCDDRVVAVAAEDLSIRWMFRYSGIVQRAEFGGPDLVLRGSMDLISASAVDRQNRWIDFLPRIAKDRVLITPRDADQMFCLNLTDGRQLWTRPRGTFHAIAGVSDERVVLIGNRSAAAVSLKTGESLWNTELRHGVTSGTCSFDGTVLQIPTNAPAIVTLDTRSGRELVALAWPGPELPGNLLSTPGGLLSAGLTTITRLPAGDGAPLPSEQAAEFLVQGRRDDARKLLEEHLALQPDDGPARIMLIDLLLEVLRSDYTSNRAIVEQLRNLLAQSSRDLELAPMLHSLLTMGPADAVVLGEQLRASSRRQRQELSEIIARGEPFAASLPFPEFLNQVRERLPLLAAASTAASAAGSVERSEADVLAGVLQRGLESRSPRERSQIQQMLTSAAAAVAAGLPNTRDRLAFAQLLIRGGLPQTAAELLNDPSLKWDAAEIRVTLNMALLESARQTGAAARQATQQLLANWQAANAHWQASTWLQDLQLWQKDTPNATGWQPAGPDEQQAMLQLAAAEFPALLQAPDSPWQGTVTAEPSDDRTMLPVREFASTIPHRAIPIFGHSGLYRGWRLMWVQPGDRVAAYDPHGKIRWVFKPLGVQAADYQGYRPDSWAFTSGDLIVLCLPGLLLAVDGIHIGPDGGPQVLWQKLAEPESQTEDPDNPDPRDFIPPENRVESFAWNPGGHFPVGPVSAFGVPVISNRRLSMLNPRTGQRLWACDSIPPDARLLTVGSRLLILSESARTIDVRSQIDGELLETTGLPDWWAEANANVGSSVEDIEVEPGSETLWRVDVQDHCCILFRLTAGSAVLESRDLLRNQPVWSLPLPQRTVFSNPQDGIIAVLCEGQRLLLVRCDTGRILTDLQVQPIPRPRQLHLQQAQGKLLVLPEARSEEDPSMDFFNPLIDAVHVHGAIWAIDQQSLQLAWQQPVTHRQVRGLTSTQARPLLSTSPLLVLLSRNRTPKPGGGFSVPVGAQVLDVQTGRLLYEDDSTGLTQNELWLSPNPENNRICLSFDRRIVIFQWKQEPPAAGTNQ